MYKDRLFRCTWSNSQEANSPRQLSLTGSVVVHVIPVSKAAVISLCWCFSAQNSQDGPDSVFSDRSPVEADYPHDEDAHNRLNVRFAHDGFADSNDSGVGPSPRSPGAGYKSLQDASIPPAWLQNVRCTNMAEIRDSFKSVHEFNLKPQFADW